MVVIAKNHINEFVRKHPASYSALLGWYTEVKRSDWANFAELRKIFGSVDAVGNDRYVFNIKGNDFRLIAMIFFGKRTVYIRFIGTHAAYDKIRDCSTI